MKTWIVVANRTEAKIFSFLNHRSSDVQFVTKIENPRGRLRPGQINADKPGVFSSKATHGTKLVKPQSPTERIAQDFAKEVTHFLEQARLEHHFEDLILISDPHFIGRLRGLFTKDLSRTVSREIIKDLGNVTGIELKDRLWPEFRPEL